MASKSFLIFTIAILVLLLPCFSHPNHHNPHNKKLKSLSEFFKNLEGCKKGDKIEGISQLKDYLKYFGYFNQSCASNDLFDELLESAIKIYQKNFNITVCGTLSPETVSMMSMPRCGIPDIVNGTNYMQQKNHSHHFHTVFHYAFFPGRPKWPASKYRLTYAFPAGTRSDARNAVTRAFRTWASKTQFTFSLARSYRTADLKISFQRGNHGDGYPFDGMGGVLAHAFAPKDGRFHYDAAEKWVVGAIRGGYDLQTVALHEIGHLLGLGHSSVRQAIMYPTIMSGSTKGLNADDIRGIKVLYNIR